jgi:hypothetical protein
MRPALVYQFTKLLNYQIFPSAAGRFGYSRFSNCCKSDSEPSVAGLVTL